MNMTTSLCVEDLLCNRDSWSLEILSHDLSKRQRDDLVEVY